MLSVFKLVSCKHGAFRELSLRPEEALRSSKSYKLVFRYNVIVVNRNKFNFVGF